MAEESQHGRAFLALTGAKHLRADPGDETFPYLVRMLDVFRQAEPVSLPGKLIACLSRSAGPEHDAHPVDENPCGR